MGCGHYMPMPVGGGLIEIRGRGREGRRDLVCPVQVVLLLCDDEFCEVKFGKEDIVCVYIGTRCTCLFCRVLLGEVNNGTRTRTCFPIHPYPIRKESRDRDLSSYLIIITKPKDHHIVLPKFTIRARLAQSDRASDSYHLFFVGLCVNLKAASSTLAVGYS